MSGTVTRPLPAPRLRARATGMRAVLALMLREMGSTYGRSPGGYIWAILQPIGIIVILSIGFSLLVKTPSLGTSFLLFYATGYLPYYLYDDLAKKIAKALSYSRPMLAYPRVTWLDTILARFILNTLTLVTVTCIILTLVLIITDTRTVLDIRPVIVAMAMAALLGLGAGMVNCLLIGLFPVWGIIWRILTRPMFIASGVIFIYEDMPRVVQEVLWWNPVLHVTGLMRTGFYPTYYPQYVSLLFGFGVGLVLVALGLVFLRAYHKRVITR